MKVLITMMNDSENNQLKRLSVLAIAYIGDAIYELCSRTYVLNSGNYHSHEMHNATVRLVNAKAQAKASEKLINVFTESELDYFRRGKNAKVNSCPKGATEREYHLATGIETVFGYLYLTNNFSRIDELYSLITDEN